MTEAEIRAQFGILSDRINEVAKEAADDPQIVIISALVGAGLSILQQFFIDIHAIAEAQRHGGA